MQSDNFYYYIVFDKGGVYFCKYQSPSWDRYSPTIMIPIMVNEIPNNTPQDHIIILRYLSPQVMIRYSFQSLTTKTEPDVLGLVLGQGF
jgi:hypothetical protein